MMFFAFKWFFDLNFMTFIYKIIVARLIQPGQAIPRVAEDAPKRLCSIGSTLKSAILI